MEASHLLGFPPVWFGFLNTLLVMASEQPEAMAIAFDLGLPTFRHEADDTYKADRPGTPEDFVDKKFARVAKGQFANCHGSRLRGR